MDYWKDLKYKNKIKYLYIVVYTKINDSNPNTLLLLLGKESNSGRMNKTDSNLFSDYWGIITDNESIPECAGRILFEKTMNMITEPFEFEKLVLDNKIPYLVNTDKIIFAYKINYNEHKYLPNYYNKIFNYLSLCMTSNSLNMPIIETCPVGFFDKSEFKWFNSRDIIKFDEQSKIKKRFLKTLFLIFDKLL